MRTLERRLLLRDPARLLVLLLAGLLSTFAHPSRAAAQQCAPTDAYCLAGQPPVVWTAPGDTAWADTTATTQVAVTVHWCAPYSTLDPGSATLYLDGDSLTGFTYTTVGGTHQFGTQHCQHYATSTGTITVGAGEHVLQASIARGDDANNVGQWTTTFTHTYTPTPHYGVDVGPASSTVERPAGKAATEAFSLTNTGNVPTTYTLQAVCSGAAVGCTASAGSVTVAAGATRAVAINYSASTTVGATGTLRLKAWKSDATAVRDSGAYALTTVTAPAPGSVGETSDMTLLERSACVSAAAGEGAAYECGDLRLAHGLPGVRLLNRSTAPTLIYNSQHASPYVIVPASVAGPTGTRPDTIRATVTVNGVNYSSRWPGWTSDSTKRIAVGFDAAALATGVYPYTLTVTATWNGGATQALPGRTGELAVVNRKASPFGAGWWLAGLEQLVPLTMNNWLWIGGDGSTRVYRMVVPELGDPGACIDQVVGQPPTYTCGAWVADAYDRPDTLKVVGSQLVRRLPGGIEVRFAQDGHHAETVNALGQGTSFVWSGTYLTRIDLPVSGYSYTFTYGNNSSTRLSSVGSPGSRSTAVTTDASGRVTRFTDPDTRWVGFGYPSTSTRVSTRTNRMGWTSEFLYGDGQVLSYSRVPVAVGDTIRRQFRSAQELGLRTATPVASVYTTLYFPRHATGSADYAFLYLDRFGAPVQVRNTLAQNTYVSRYDPRFPGLVTRVQRTNGAAVTAAYDERGNLLTQTDLSTSVGGSYATTLYEWDPVWDKPTRVTQPEGEFTLTSYDAYGRPAWMQVGADSARRTRFTYYALNHATAPGLILSVWSPRMNAETYAYDARGNLSTVTAPTGLQTLTMANAIGRVDSVASPGGAKRRMTYDAADQVVEEESYGPARLARSSFTADSTYSAEHVWVHTYRNANGQPDSVARWQSPDQASIGRIVTHWRYDGVGRTLVEIAPDSTPGTLADNPRDSTVYDPDGNATDVFTRRGFHITMRYDSLSRLTRRITPAATLSIDSTSIAWASPTPVFFPYFGQDAEGNFTGGTASATRTVVIPADTATFGYDSMGNLLWANNRDARVSRTWNANGSMASETQRIRAYAGTDTLTHAYRLDFQYDLEGRRTALIHPASISPHAPARDTTRYGYDPIIGGLATVSGQGSYGFAYDAAGRTAQITRGGTHETFQFDLGGRMYSRQDWSGSLLLHSDVTTFSDTTGEVTRVTALRETVLQARRGLGALAWVDSYDPNKGTRNVEYFATDPLTNQIATRMEATSATEVLPSLRQNEAEVHHYEHNTGRLLSAWDESGTAPFEASRYDAAGNQVLRRSIAATGTPYTNGTVSNVTTPLRDESAMYYGADDRLHVADRRSCLLFQGSGSGSSTWTCDPARAPAYEKRSAFEEYRYDALGRRVLVRTRSEFACAGNCLNTLRRIVWDGDQVLYEISAPGGSSATTAQMEADTGLAVPFFLNGQHTAVAGFFPYGRVMYEHGGGLDAPLGVVRLDYSDELRDPQIFAPHANWRGSYDRGTPIGGQCLVYTSNGKSLAPPPDSTPSSGDQYGGVVGGGTYAGQATHCVEVDWPAAYTWSARQYRRGYTGPSAWMGSLIFESRDASGLYYRRNRYYDSEKGRFTQEDPIGLAGGLNVYGFANGDPLTFRDPYGLTATNDGCDPPGSCIAQRTAQGTALGFMGGTAVAVACTAGTAGACALGPAEISLATLTAVGTLSGAVLGTGEELAGLARPAFEGTAHAMGRFGRWVRRTTGGILIGIGTTSPVPTTDSAPGDVPAPPTEAEPQGRRTPRKQQEEQQPPVK